MTKKIYLMLLSIFLSVTYLSAQVVQTVNIPTAGGLSTAIGSNLKTVTDLTLTGTINAADFNTIKQMTALKKMDMSKVAVVDNTIPAYAFASSTIKTLILPSSVKIIGSYCFLYSSTAVDFSNTKSSLTTLGSAAFLGCTGSKVLDFSDFNLLKNFEVNSLVGVFSNYSGHVVLPSYLETVPDYLFKDFKGSVSLSENIKSIGTRSFASAQMSSLALPSSLTSIGEAAFQNSKISSGLSLPSSVKVIGNYCFHNSSIAVDFSKTKSSLISLGSAAFGDYTGSKVLDFSDFNLLKNFEINSLVGVFSNYSGHVVLPSYLETVPDYLFKDFKGSVSLSENIKSIGTRSFALTQITALALPSSLTSIGEAAFQGSSITSIDIPASVTSIGGYAFHNATKLSKIISNNPTPPVLGSNAFLNVNKETTTLEVPKESLNLYGSAAQWKDFLNISGRVPSKLDLIYKINTGNISYKTGVTESGKPDKIVSYQAVRIGEYYWMNTNFNHKEPNISATWDNVNYKQISGLENLYPLTKERLNLGLDRTFIDTLQYQFDITEFTKTYGVYYHYDTQNFMNGRGRIYENNSDTAQTGWNLPSVGDFRQLVGMSAFRSSSTELTNQDIAASLVAPMYSNSMISRDVYDNYGANLMYWYYYGSVGGNPYGFNFMMGGDCQNEVAPPGNYYDLAYDVDRGLYQRFYAQTGDIVQLFNRGELAARDGSFSLHETVDTRQLGYHTDARTYHWLPVRWCRLLTDEELGYKLYIKIDNIDKSSKEWKDLSQNNYEITLLNSMRNNNISTDYTSIIKLGLNEVAPEGYIELPHGYIRGFYVQYILDQPNTTVTVSDIMKYAYNVEDYVLDMGGANHSRVPGSSIPGYVAPQTKSLVSDESVVPFKTDASVTLYPNPVQDVLNISGEGVEKVTIYDMSGRQVSTAKNVNTISVSNLSKGTYLVRVLTVNGESTHKVIKKQK